MHLGEIIKTYRKTNQISMDDFAKLSNLSKPYISMLEKNKNSRSGKPIVPSITTLKKVAQAINITLDDLLKELDAGQEITLLSNDKENFNFHATEAEQELVKKYRVLPPEGKATVDAVLNVQYDIVKPKVIDKKII